MHKSVMWSDLSTCSIITIDGNAVCVPYNWASQKKDFQKVTFIKSTNASAQNNQILKMVSFRNGKTFLLWYFVYVNFFLRPSNLSSCKNMNILDLDRDLSISHCLINELFRYIQGVRDTGGSKEVLLYVKRVPFIDKLTYNCVTIILRKHFKRTIIILFIVCNNVIAFTIYSSQTDN